jgi:hypothetical protein
MVLAACGASLAACAGVRAPAGGACLPVGAMRLEMRHGDEWEPVAWLDEDGGFHQEVNRRVPRAGGRVAGDAVVDATGKVAIRCDADHVIHQEGSPFTMRFGADDALADKMDRIYVRDDGFVEASFLRAHPPEVAPWRVVARLPEQRRTAEMLVLMAMMSADWESLAR